MHARPSARTTATSVISSGSTVAKRSPILGYNHNVRFRGIVFHVQTEDSGIINPHVFTHLFHGGVILTTRKLVYDPGATEDVVKALMQAQHKAVLKDLRRGSFDDKIDQYLAGTPGLLPRGAGAEAEATPTDEPATVSAAPVTFATAAERSAPVEEPPPVIEEPAPVEEPARIAAPALVVPPAPLATAARIAAPPPPTMSAAGSEPALDPIAYEIEAHEPSGPAIEVIEPPPSFDGPEPSHPAIEVVEPASPFELDEPSAPALELGPAGDFDSVTARTPPPVTTPPPSSDETERVPVMAFPEISEALPLTRPGDSWTPPPSPVRVSFTSRIPVPAAPEVVPLDELRPEPTPQLARTPTPVMPVARTHTPVVAPPAPPPPPHVAGRPAIDVVALDDIETPPGGVSSFADLLPAAPPPLPPDHGTHPGVPPPPLVRPGDSTSAPTLRAHRLTPPADDDAAPPTRPVGRPPSHESVPRLAGVPAPTPTAPGSLGAAPPPTPAPSTNQSLRVPQPTFARPPSENTPRVSLLQTPIDDDDLLAAGLVESSDVAEVHAPPLPSAVAPPGAQPERPGEYYVTRSRPEAPPPSRPVPPRPTPPIRPVPQRPTIPAAAAQTFRGTGAPAPASARPSPRSPTRPPIVPPPAPAPPRVDAPTMARTDSPAVARPAARPARPRPTTGAGVVVSRPAVIVGAPTRPPTAPGTATRPRRARDTGTEGLVSERSLDEVILAYLSEDATEE